MAPEVRCTVDECHYWKNDLCTANKIEVAKNFGGITDIEAGMMGKKSKTSIQTKCNTFKPKKK